MIWTNNPTIQLINGALLAWKQANILKLNECLLAIETINGQPKVNIIITRIHEFRMQPLLFSG